MKSIFSLSQVLLALAIIYFAFALLKFSSEIPAFISAIDRATPHISTVVEEVELVREEVTQVRMLVDKQVPEILEQIGHLLPLIEQGLAQSEQLGQQIPDLWLQLDKIEKQFNLVHKEIPQILSRIDDVVLTSNEAINEAEKWRPHSTQYIEVIKQSREDIPQYLTRVDNIILDAKSIGKEASSGLVSGLFKGVVSMPFEVVAGLTGMVDSTSLSAKYLTANDVIKMQEKVISLLENQSKKQVFWQNNESGNRGKIIKNKAFIKDNQTCHKVTFFNYFKKRDETLDKTMCKDKTDIWQLM
jgi:surface antigen